MVILASGCEKEAKLVTLFQLSQDLIQHFTECVSENVVNVSGKIFVDNYLKGFRSGLSGTSTPSNAPLWTLLIFLALDHTAIEQCLHETAPKKTEASDWEDEK